MCAVAVNIREYYADAGGKMRPSTTGIAMPAVQWHTVEKAIPEIDLALKVCATEYSIAFLCNLLCVQTSGAVGQTFPITGSRHIAIADNKGEVCNACCVRTYN